MVDCSQTTVKHGSEGDTYTPTARIVYIEPVLDKLDAEVIQEIMGRNRAQRVGHGTMSFELGLSEVRAGDTVDHGASE